MMIQFSKKCTIAALAICATATTMNAQDTLSTKQLLGQLNTITTAVPFLLIGPDSRSGGMGEVGAAVSPDANSIHWGAAKLAFARQNAGIGISYTPWLRQLVPDINLGYLSGYKKIDENQALAVSLRYFSLGNITFTDIVGNVTGQFNPNEFAFDLAYARKLSEFFSGGLTLRYINSNLTGGIEVQGTQTRAGRTVAADLSGYYEKESEIFNKDGELAFGFAITNIGGKISYSETGTKDFIPINLRLGGAARIKLNEYNEIAWMLDFNKLLVPTPPVYGKDTNGVNYIISGKDPNRTVPAGIFGSFSDAPGGYREELKEINIATGFEYWYDKQFAFRFGYFHEPATKGNRKFFTLGAGLKYNIFGLDFAYLIPTQQRHPLENTLRFSLLFDLGAQKSSGGDNTGD